MPGLYFEEFEVGKTYDHSPSRSVTAFDDIWYSCLTGNTQPLHINIDFCERKGLYKKNMFNSLYTLGIVLGQTVTDLTRGTMVETLNMTDLDFPRPVFHDDTLYSRTKVVSKSPGDAKTGVVELFHEGLNQKGEVVATCRRTIRVRTRPH